MATIKSFTSLEQSKVLAEILPLESADMFYADLFVGDTHQYIVHPLESYGFKTFRDTNNRTSKRLNFVPCWSLAALLNVLPSMEIEKVICSDNTYDYRVKVCIGNKYTGNWYSNPIDACVDMIVGLHKLKML